MSVAKPAFVFTKRRVEVQRVLDAPVAANRPCKEFDSQPKRTDEVKTVRLLAVDSCLLNGSLLRLKQYLHQASE